MEAAGERVADEGTRDFIVPGTPLDADDVDVFPVCATKG